MKSMKISLARSSEKWRQPLCLGFCCFALTGVVGAAESSLEQKVERLEKRVSQLEAVVRLLLNENRVLDEKAQRLERAARAPRGGGNWRIPGNWQKLQNGMLAAEVEGLLGLPTAVDEGAAITSWIYTDGANFMGEVRFVSGTMEVLNWRTP